MSPSPAPSAAAALASGSAVAATVRKTMSQDDQRGDETEGERRHTPVALADVLERIAGELDLQGIATQIRQVVVDAVEELLVIVRRLPGDVRDRDRLARGQQGRLSRYGDSLARPRT